MTGRASYPIRPGLLIKDYLLDHGSASIAELHHHYKDMVGEENQFRSRGKEMRPMHYASFCSYVHNCVKLELMHKVGTRPIKGKPTHGLLSIRGSGENARVVPSTQAVYELTPRGHEDDEAWSNPIKALGY